MGISSTFLIPNLGECTVSVDGGGIDAKMEGNGLIISGGNSNAQIYSQRILTTTCSYTFMIDSQSIFDTVESILLDDGQKTMTVFINSELVYIGTLQLEQSSKTIKKKGFFTMVANDFAPLKLIDYDNYFILRETQIQTLDYCLDKLNYGIQTYYSFDELYEEQMSNNNSPLQQAFLNPLWFFPEDNFGNIFMPNLWDVVESILTSKGLRLRQFGGIYYLEQFMPLVFGTPPVAEAPVLQAEGFSE